MKYITLFTALVATCTFAFGNQISESQKPFIEKYKNQKSKIAPTDALLNTDAEPNLSDGFVSLYNGKNLDGWTARGGNCTFEANGDVITGTTVPGSPSTYLSTDKDYGDFVFTAELKWEVDGNSGIIFRGASRPVKGKKFEHVYGPQAEMEGFNPMLGTRRGWSGGIYGQGYSAWIYPLWLDAHKEARATLKEDAWNRITIKAVGDNVKTWVNGIPAANWNDGEFKKGFFSLQIHAGKQGIVHFRNIKVKELSTEPGFEDLFSTGDFSQWTNPQGKAVGKGWSIENGVIHRGGIKPGGINTKKKYKDFELRFDWKISEAGNSGVKYRAHGGLGLEYQVLDDEKHNAGKTPYHQAGSIYELVAAKADKPINPVGKWNSARVIAKDNHIEHWLNGAKVAEIEYGSADWKKCFEKSKYSKHEGFGDWTGTIHLQDHNDEVWFKNVQIREL
ncbi:MAG: 3-keto-disaccharide hydrolase [Opitutaceae bacterium]